MTTLNSFETLDARNLERTTARARVCAALTGLAPGACLEVLTTDPNYVREFGRLASAGSVELLVMEWSNQALRFVMCKAQDSAAWAG